MRTFITALFAAAVGVIAGSVITLSGVADAQSAGRVVTLPTKVCVTDHSDNCYFDAGARGNHIGCSYWVTNGTVRYLDPRVNKMTDAKRYKHCTSTAR